MYTGKTLHPANAPAILGALHSLIWNWELRIAGCPGSAEGRSGRAPFHGRGQHPSARGRVLRPRPGRAAAPRDFCYARREHTSTLALPSWHSPVTSGRCAAGHGKAAVHSPLFVLLKLHFLSAECIRSVLLEIDITFNSSNPCNTCLCVKSHVRTQHTCGHSLLV